MAMVKDLAAKLSGTKPGLAVVIVGEDPASQVYVTAKSEKARSAAFTSFSTRCPATQLKIISSS